jgi:hypothetical protein
MNCTEGFVENGNICLPVEQVSNAFDGITMFITNICRYLGRGDEFIGFIIFVFIIWLAVEIFRRYAK